MNYDDLRSAWDWNPIRDCPGRYTLAARPGEVTVADLLGLGIEVREFRLPAVRDLVLVACFDAGGLISYRRSNGSCLHTLNDAEGFRRKLDDLGIAF